MPLSKPGFSTMSKASQDKRRGVALVIVLSMIVLITALVVSFTVSMRTERQAARSTSENERTKLVAEAALAHAVSILSSNIPQPVPPGVTRNPVNWSISPGMLNIIRPGTQDYTQIPLSSNPNADYVSGADDANLNLLQASTNQYPIITADASGTAYPMSVAWISLLQSPASPASATNPMVARYAFWIDDENAKININTAYGKPAGMVYSNLTPGTITEASSPAVGPDDVVPLGHSGSVDLSVLDPSVDPRSLLYLLKTYGAAKSPEMIKAVYPGTDAAKETFYQNNKFYLTATSRDPEFNVFGKSRLYMFASLPSLLGTKQSSGLFQRFRDLDAPMYFHGNENRDSTLPAPTAADPSGYPAHNPYQDYTAMYYTAKKISSILSSNNWPGMPTRSFVDKWGGNDAAIREADQVAWNLVAMGSFADLGAYAASTPGLSSIFANRLLPGVTGSSGSINYPNAAVPIGAASGKAIVPAMPRPMIDEICLNILPQSQTVDNKKKYRLLFTASYGVWLPPGYPATDFSQQSCDFFVGLTHLEYNITQDNNASATQTNSQYLNNTVYGIKKMQAFLNTGVLPNTDTGARRLTLLPVQNQVDPTLTPDFYARNGANFSNSPTADVTFSSTGTVRVQMRMRLFVQSVSQAYAEQYQGSPSQLIPVWDKYDPGATAALKTWNDSPPGSNLTSPFYPPLDDTDDCVEFDFKLDLSQFPDAGNPYTRSLWVADPRTGGSSKMWVPSWTDSSGNDQPTVLPTDTLGKTYNGATAAALASGSTLDKFGYIDMTAPSGTTANSLPHPSIGLFSLVPTGMQRGIFGSTLKLQPSQSSTELPDWLLLDLFAPTISLPATSTGWADIAKMNSTAGKININAAIYPNSGNFTVPKRLVPLRALLNNTPARSDTAQNVVDHILASGGSSYAGARKFYNYPGEICEIKGVADTGTTDFVKEAIVRNFASTITTKSNTFSVWGVAQTVKKASINHQYGQYEKGDLVTGEKRFQAIVERYVWPGADGVVGNGSIGTGGTYDSLTQGATQPGAAPTPTTAIAYDWEKLDGSDYPTYPINSADPANATMNPQYDPYNSKAQSRYTTGAPESANNPVGATMKYRVIYFKYLE